MKPSPPLHNEVGKSIFHAIQGKVYFTASMLALGIQGLGVVAQQYVILWLICNRHQRWGQHLKLAVEQRPALLLLNNAGSRCMNSTCSKRLRRSRPSLLPVKTACRTSRAPPLKAWNCVSMMDTLLALARSITFTTSVRRLGLLLPTQQQPKC